MFVQAAVHEHVHEYVYVDGGAVGRDVHVRVRVNVLVHVRSAAGVHEHVASTFTWTGRRCGRHANSCSPEREGNTRRNVRGRGGFRGAANSPSVRVDWYAWGIERATHGQVRSCVAACAVPGALTAVYAATSPTTDSLAIAGALSSMASRFRPIPPPGYLRPAALGVLGVLGALSD